MNENHAQVCSSAEWAEYLQTEVLPDVTRCISLGGRMLEVGPGPGAATEWLRHRVASLTVVEVDEAAALRLKERYSGTNVEVITGSGAWLGFPDESFDFVGTFTMLHHVPTTAQQNKILGEALRVLRPGGVLIGSDSLASNDLHVFHADDTYNPVEPSALLTRLQTLGFENVTLIVDHSLKFAARKARASQPEDAQAGSAPPEDAG